MLSPVIRVDASQFNAALRSYMQHSKRELSEVINQKAYSISMAAVSMTKKANKAEIRRALNAEIVGNRHVGPRRGTTGTGPRAALLVNWNRGRKNLPGLYGGEMREAVELKTQRRADGVNFLRAGWLPAVAKFARAIHPQRSPGANAKNFLNRFGYHGDGTPARPGTNPLATFYNMAFTRHTSTDAGYKYAADGLQRAIAQEISRMARHVAGKMQALSGRFALRFFS